MSKTTEQNIERRTFTGTVELRMAEGADFPAEVTGIAAVVNQRTDIGWFEEEIAPGAFDDALTFSDIRALFNHDPNRILGRTAAGTAKVWVNDEGHLAYSFTPDPSNPEHVSVVRSIQRGDITQSSFAFITNGVQWVWSDKYGQEGTRRILRMKELYDVSPVTYPAYSGTSVGSRDAEAIRQEREAIIAEREAQTEAAAAELAKQRNARKDLAGIIAKTI
jgi:HK97 family phage prohead protease